MTDPTDPQTPDNAAGSEAGRGSENGRNAWQAPHEASRQTGEQSTAAPGAEQPTEPIAGETPTGPAEPTAPPALGAPPLPGETPAPLADTKPYTGFAAPDGAHHAPPSLDHAAYAGSNSAAYAGLSNSPQADVNPAAPGAWSYDAATASAAPSGWQAPDARRPRRRGLGGFVAVAVVAAVIGALVATGGYALFGARGSNDATGGTSDTLSIGHYKDASLITAVAAKATPSVVTIDVAAGTSAGTGSGVVLTGDGYIVTNTHVVTLDGASAKGTIRVTTSGGQLYSGKLIGTDPLVDLAVIKIDATGLTPIAFADSSKLNVGDTTVAIGAPLGLSNTVTDGIVSTLNRSITVASSAAPDSSDDSSSGSENNGQGPFSFDNGSGSSTSTSSTISLPVIQTDASINPGNSGGALLDTDGKLIGINVAIASAGSSSSSSSASGSIGVGFSIPANLVERVANDIKDTGSATHGLLGASVDDSTNDTSATHTGALIKSLTSGGAAETAGLRAGDIVTKFDGIPITGATDLTAQVRTLAGGSTASLTYIRDGSTKSLTVDLGTLKA
ncbi:putative serine protease PepD [Frondihabitans sp. PhB188]|uniref:S1C family serine protease n=1 Tax=Frondihabitans sp. PhB188 TaxID=2485200 RepID=UPI000F4A2F8F|nr:trypsin-like peptidase domain-containing protein [Frondihabitans sp. PhB188]ROQ38410.1 putative serine protease PepD [Frondihabitans sp. PhB188]